MPEFEFIIEQKETIWRKNFANIEADTEEEAIKKVRSVIPDRSIPFSQALFSAVYDFNTDVNINDIEEPEDVVGTISMKTMQDRIQLCCTEDNSWAILNEINENGDAVSSDIIFQYIVMGEVTFG